MQTSSDYLAALLTNYQTRFNKTIGERLQSDDILAGANTFDSTTLTEVVPWTGDVPSVSNVTHDVVQFEDMNQYTQSLENQVWQSGWEIDREAFADDRHKLFADKPNAAARAAGGNIAVEVGSLLESTTLAYDAAAFFGTTRTIGSSAAIVNTIAGSGTSTAQLLTDLAAAQVKQFGFQTDKGNKLGWIGTQIYCPIELFQTWWDALSANSSVESGEKRAMPGGLTFTIGRYTVTVVPELTDADNWFLAYVTPDAKPFVVVMRDKPVLEGTTSTESYEWRVLRKSQYTTYGRYVVGWGDPRSIVRTTN